MKDRYFTFAIKVKAASVKEAKEIIHEDEELRDNLILVGVEDKEDLIKI